MPYPWIPLSVGMRRGSNEGFVFFIKLNDKPFIRYIHLCLMTQNISPDVDHLIYWGHFYNIIVIEHYYSYSHLGEQSHCWVSEPWPRSTAANVLFLLQQQILSLVCYDWLLNTKEWSSQQTIAVFWTIFNYIIFYEQNLKLKLCIKNKFCTYWVKYTMFITTYECALNWGSLV